MGDETVLHRIEVRVVHMGRVVAIVPNCVLPVSLLPDNPFATPGHDRRPCFGSRQRFRNRLLDRAPSTREIGVSFGQGPKTVHVVGQDDPGVDVERGTRPHLPHCFAQRVDVAHQIVRPAIEQIYREEVGSAGDSVSAIVGHDCN